MPQFVVVRAKMERVGIRAFAVSSKVYGPFANKDAAEEFSRAMSALHDRNVDELINFDVVHLRDRMPYSPAAHRDIVAALDANGQIGAESAH